MTVAPSEGTLWTIGHWTCPRDDFLRPLLDAEIEQLVDVRALPGSRRSPQFDSEEMQQWLADSDIGYQHLAELGGRRKRQDVDPDLNAGWRNASFKNYADYTLTEPFRDGFEQLTTLATERRTVIMCGEPMPWRCHRLLLSNLLVARGWTVRHLIVDSAPRDHQLGQWGAEPVVDAGRVTYPAETAS